MSTFGELFKKAHGAIASLRGTNNVFLGKDGEVVFSKNNVCVHESSDVAVGELDEYNVVHTPGYLTIHCLSDERMGVTLVLQWLPNSTLEKNPSSIRCVSPRRSKKSDARDPNSEQSSSSQNHRYPFFPKGSKSGPSSSQEQAPKPPDIAEPTVTINGTSVDVPEIVAPSDRPQTLQTMNAGLGVPDINVIPNTPVDPRTLLEDYDEHIVVTNKPKDSESQSQSSGETSGADEVASDREIAPNESSGEDSDAEEAKKLKTYNLETYRKTCSSFSETPENFAQEHNLIMDTGSTAADESARFGDGQGSRPLPAEADLQHVLSFRSISGRCATMRLFFSNPECTCGQLVIASLDSQYKILHFHHGGLDRLAKIFEDWNAIKSRSVKDGSPSPVPDRQLLICQPEVNRTELDPEEDVIFDRVNFEFWKMCQKPDGSHEDSFTIRKAIYFASMEPSLRKELWPFLLRVYNWESTFEQREQVRNDLFLEYNNIKRRRSNPQDVIRFQELPAVRNRVDDHEGRRANRSTEILISPARTTRT
ncbi:TBC1 domain family member 16 [Aphelenchoides fujianensis]|nr:TBC1 domain family member 16 [Aphelenchoides fujianensis]